MTPRKVANAGGWLNLRSLRSKLCLSPLLHVPLLLYCDAGASEWSVAPRGSIPLDVSALAAVAEMSGITFTGGDAGAAQFAAVQDAMGQVVEIQVSLRTDGTIESAAATRGIHLGVVSDFEAVAFSSDVRNSIFVADESAPAIREFGLAAGEELQSFELPPPFDLARDNFGLESLTRTADGGRLWTANEEALTPDGPQATSEVGTTARLVEIILQEDFALATRRQFAYQVEPVHAVHAPSEGTRSGLVDLVGLPGGGLLSLERSLAFDSQTGLPLYESRIYEVLLEGATDVSREAFLAGLEGQTYVPAGKILLWRGQAGGFLGQNLEGLSLGPQLEDGRWSLVGVVDDGDPLSGNTLVAFELTRSLTQLPGDYNASGRVEQADLDLVLLHWGQDATAVPAGWTGRPPAGIIDQDELDGVLLHWGDSAAAAENVPEPAAIMLLVTAGSALAALRKGRIGPRSLP